MPVKTEPGVKSRATVRQAKDWEPYKKDDDAGSVPAPAFLSKGVPGFIQTQLLPNIASSDPAEAGGTSIHLGAGWILTARHVLAVHLSQHPDYLEGVAIPKDGYVGSQKMVNAPGWSVVRVPPPGTYQNGAAPSLKGLQRDWAIYKTDAISGSSELTLRTTQSLKRGERLWVIGDQTAGRFRVSTGFFAGAHDFIGEVKGARTESGFSGGGVVDAEGHLVGLVFARGRDSFGTGRDSATFFIPIEKIVEDLNEQRRLHPDVRLPKLVLTQV
jgi:S1-C subfamily serine protease